MLNVMVDESFDDPSQCTFMWDGDRDTETYTLTIHIAMFGHDWDVEISCPYAVKPAPGGGEPEKPAPGGGEPVKPAPGGGEPEKPAPGGGEPEKPAPGGGEPEKPAPGGGEPEKPEGPIVHLFGDCPSSSSGSPIMHLVADVPAHAKAKCKNGAAVFSTTNDVDYVLPGKFLQTYSGEDCLFFKKNGSNTFTVEVEVGWGEKHGQVLSYTLTRTISCAYDDHDNALSSDETIGDWFLSPGEVQSLKGSESAVQFDLKVLDVLNEEIDTDHISIGRKIRLMATNATNSVAGFRALSCDAKTSETSYAILRAGCGDGLIFPKSKGFVTEGAVVYSPYFEAFRLREVSSIQFECNFTVCTSPCDGSSCPTERKRRSFWGKFLKIVSKELP